MNKNRFTCVPFARNASSSSPLSRMSRPARLFLTAVLPALPLLISVEISRASSATWSAIPGSGDWNTADNWVPMTVPNGPADTATFAVTNHTAVSVSANTEVNGMTFDPGASAFTIAVGPMLTLNISGSGIVNNSGTIQNFAISESSALLQFINSATAGSSTSFTNSGSTIDFGAGGATQFSDTSSACNGTFTNNGGNGVFAGGGGVNFLNSSSAANWHVY
jgi:hypothetical protein